jgi:uncharacterized protein YbbK (DUF523 family)
MTFLLPVPSTIRLTLLCIILSALLPGCSNRQIYEGLQAGKRGECQKLQEPDRSRCLDSADVRYEDYKRERDKDVK